MHQRTQSAHHRPHLYTFFAIYPVDDNDNDDDASSTASFSSRFITFLSAGQQQLASTHPHSESLLICMSATARRSRYRFQYSHTKTFSYRPGQRKKKPYPDMLSEYGLSPHRLTCTHSIPPVPCSADGNANITKMYGPL
jgi:hypothetical protein